MYNDKLRSKWDNVVEEFGSIERISEYNDILYYYLDPGFGVAIREFVLNRYWQKDYPNKGDISMIFCSTEYPSKPLKKGWIRAESIISGYLLRPVD